MAKLNSAHFVANYDKSVIVKDEHENETIDLSQLKDREILTKDSEQYKNNDLIVVKKDSIPDQESNYTMFPQVADTIYKLVAKGQITTINVLSVSTEQTGEDPNSVQIGVNAFAPFSIEEDLVTGDLIIDRGDWNNTTIQSLFGIKPCVLNSEGVVTKYLDPNDYTRFYYPNDPNTWYNDNDCTSPKTGENIMIEFNKLYTRKEVVDGKLYVYLSPDKSIDNENWVVHPAFLSEKEHGQDIYGNPKYADKIYISAFPSSNNVNTATGKTELCSRAVLASGNTYKNALEYARNIGPGFEILNYSKLSLLYDIYMIMTCCKSLYENKYIHSNNNTIIDIETSLTQGLVNIFKARTSNGEYEWHTKFLGITDLFNMKMFVAGINTVPSDEDSNKVKIYQALHGPYVSSLDEIKDRFPDHYKYTGVETTVNPNENNNKKVKLDTLTPADGNLIFSSKNGYYSPDMPFSPTNRYLQLVQYIPNPTSKSLYMVFGAGQNSNESITHQSIETLTFKTLFTYS